MKSFSFAKVLTLGCFAFLLPIACGDDDDDTNPLPTGGAAGETSGVAGQSSEGGAGGEAPAPVVIPGTGTSSETIQCGGDDCTSTKTQLPNLWIDPCCTATADTCGVSSGFLSLLKVDLKGACLPKNQPGELDAACPDSPANSVPFMSSMVGVKPFKGCCRAATNTCGFVVNAIVTDVLGTFTSPELGCVDSGAFTGKPGAACGEGAGGGGAGGAGGGDAGGAPSDGGAPISGGAGGAGGTP